MGRVTGEHLEQFADEGYVVVPDVLDPARDIEPVLAELGGVLDVLAGQLHAEGAISRTYADRPFPLRIIDVYRESGRTFSQWFDISLPQKAVRADMPIHVGPAIFGFLTSPSLLDAVEAFVGPEIYSNPVQHVRIKPPVSAVAVGSPFDGLVSRTAWHQDNGVILPEADEATILTVWTPLTRATVENGCLQVVPGSHRAGLESHCPVEGKGVSIPDRLVPLDRARPLPMEPGSVLFMTQRTIHSSLDNVTADEVRVSCDLRYQQVGQPTGRPAFPGFVARSRAHPETELRDPVAWARSWHDTRARLAARETPVYNRWRADAPVCA